MLNDSLKDITLGLQREIGGPGFYTMNPAGSLENVHEVFIERSEFNPRQRFSNIRVRLANPYEVESILIDVPARREVAQFEGDSELLDITPSHLSADNDLIVKGFTHEFELEQSAQVIQNALKLIEPVIASLIEIEASH